MIACVMQVEFQVVDRMVFRIYQILHKGFLLLVWKCKQIRKHWVIFGLITVLL